MFIKNNNIEYNVKRKIIYKQWTILSHLVAMVRILFSAFTGTGWAHGFITAVIAFERFICVVSPFYAQKFFKTKTMVVIIGTVSTILIGSVGAIVIIKHNYAGCVYDPFSKTTLTMVLLTKYVFTIN